MPVDDKQTLCHIIKGDRLLLKKASRGIGKGKWNATGGKLEYEDEPPEQCVEREVLEETGLKVKNLFKHGVMRFYTEGKEKPNFTVHLYSTSDFDGEVTVREGEDEVYWFDIDKIPIKEMWDDDNYWLDLMLKKKRFDADFYYSKNNDKVVKYVVRLIE